MMLGLVGSMVQVITECLRLCEELEDCSSPTSMWHKKQRGSGEERGEFWIRLMQGIKKVVTEPLCHDVLAMAQDRDLMEYALTSLSQGIPSSLGIAAHPVEMGPPLACGSLLP